MNKTGVLMSPRYRDHDNRPHPECPERLEAIEKHLEESGLLKELEIIEPYEANDDDLTLVHPQSYIDNVRSVCARGEKSALDADTVVCPESETVARLAVGGVCAAADAVLSGKVNTAMCLVRPPGHHATPTRAMGFCVYSNVAILAKWLQSKRNIGKILIVDWDVHHGNGTQEVFWKDDSVFFVSTHQHPLYPGTGREDEIGEGTGKGFTRNLPHPPGTPPQMVLDDLKEALDEITETFHPEFVLISSGFDGHRSDPLGGWKLEDESYESLTRMPLDIALEYASGRVVSVLEGGYNLEVMPKCVNRHIQVLMQAESSG